ARHIYGRKKSLARNNAGLWEFRALWPRRKGRLGEWHRRPPWRFSYTAKRWQLGHLRSVRAIVDNGHTDAKSNAQRSRHAYVAGWTVSIQARERESVSLLVGQCSALGTRYEEPHGLTADHPSGW